MWAKTPRKTCAQEQPACKVLTDEDGVLSKLIPPFPRALGHPHTTDLRDAANVIFCVGVTSCRWWVQSGAVPPHSADNKNISCSRNEGFPVGIPSGKPGGWPIGQRDGRPARKPRKSATGAIGMEAVRSADGRSRPSIASAWRKTSRISAGGRSWREPIPESNAATSSPRASKPPSKASASASLSPASASSCTVCQRLDTKCSA